MKRKPRWTPPPNIPAAIEVGSTNNMSTYIRKPEFVKAKRIASGHWDVTHHDGHCEVMTDPAFRAAFDPASMDAQDEMDGWTFGVFAKLDADSMMTIIRNVEVDVMAAALKFAPHEDVINAFFENMSPVSVKMVREKMGDLAQSRVNNTPKARHEILEMVRQLAEEGKINLNEGMALSVNSDAGPAIWNEDFE